MTISINNFSLGVGEWTPLPSTSGIFYFSVDVTDDLWSITTSQFIRDGASVTTSFSGIAGGYRCYYYPDSLVSSGVIDLTMHAGNNHWEFLDSTFHLLYGYHCSFDELVDWGPNQTVITTVEASNLAFCPNIEGEAFYFQTKDYESINLGATIRSVESVNLGATIYPQNTFFFYGRTYMVTISGVKDFSGNEMASYVVSFTIEDPLI
jgi:hypothetical protein